MDRTNRSRAGRSESVLGELAHHFRVFWSATVSGFAIFFASTPLSIFVGTAMPRYVFQAAFFVLLARFAGGPELMRFALLGNAIQIAVNMGLSSMSSVVEDEKWVGTLPILIAVPSNKLPALVGRGMVSIAEGLLAIGIALGGTLLLFGAVFEAAPFDPIRLLLAVPLVLLIVLSVGGLGLLIGSATLPTRIGTLMSNLGAYVMMILTGVNFPVAALPGWLQIVARLLPVTNGLEAVRAIIDGARYADVLRLVGAEALVMVAYFAAGYLVFELRLRTARAQGTLELL